MNPPSGVTPGGPSGQVPAVVLGRYLTALGALRALGARRIPTVLVAPASDVAARSRWARRRETPPASEDRVALASFLERAVPSGAVLVPCSDGWVRAVADLPDDVAVRFPASVPEAGVVERLIAKDRLASTLEELGVPHPRTIDIDDPADLDVLGDDELPSFFLKPRDSERFNRRFRTKGFPIEGRAQAHGQIALARDAGVAMVAQEMIESAPGGHVFLDGFVDRTGVVRAMLARRRIRMFPAGMGNSTDTVTVALPEVAPAVEALRRLFEGVRYRGPFDAEFIHDPRDGVFKMLEINVRPWWQVELAAHCGLDVVGMLYDDALGRPVPSLTRYRVGARWVNPIQDLRARRSGVRAEVPAGAQGWLVGRHGVFRWDDPMPGIAELARGAWSRRSSRTDPLPG